MPTGVHETPGAQRAMVARNLLMLTEIIEQSKSITIWHLLTLTLSAAALLVPKLLLCFVHINTGAKVVVVL